MTLGQRIKKLREEREMTLDTLSKHVGVTRQTLSRYETGVITAVPSDKIELLASALGTTPAYLMGWEEAPEDTSSNKAKLKSIIEDMSEEQAAVLLAAFLSAKTAK